MKRFKTVKDVAVLWKKDRQQYVKQSSLSTYAVVIENHILPAFGRKKELRETDIQRFVLQKLQGGLNQKTVKGILIILKMIQKFGAKHGYLPQTEWSIKYPTEHRKHKLEILSVENQRKLMQHIAENTTFRNLGIYLSLSTGMRIGEICALKWSDINLSTGTISVNRTIERIYIIESGKPHTKIVMGTPKTKNSIREIPMNSELLELIRPFKSVENDNYFVLTNEARPTEPRIYRNYYKQLLKDLDIPKLKFHGLRHTFATRCIESQCDYKTVSVLLAHANISTTLNLYVHPNMDQKRKCIDKMFEHLK
ncbi:MAG: site-specific integrase [Bacteroides sp.]|nr:site-specific integrase [Bacteroides sp.]